MFHCHVGLHGRATWNLEIHIEKAHDRPNHRMFQVLAASFWVILVIHSWYGCFPETRMKVARNATIFLNRRMMAALVWHFETQPSCGAKWPHIARMHRYTSPQFHLQILYFTTLGADLPFWYVAWWHGLTAYHPPTLNVFFWIPNGSTADPSCWNILTSMWMISSKLLHPNHPIKLLDEIFCSFSQ